jgi:hypothetical protein
MASRFITRAFQHQMIPGGQGRVASTGITEGGALATVNATIAGGLLSLNAGAVVVPALLLRCDGNVFEFPGTTITTGVGSQLVNVPNGKYIVYAHPQLSSAVSPSSQTPNQQQAPVDVVSGLEVRLSTLPVDNDGNPYDVGAIGNSATAFNNPVTPIQVETFSSVATVATATTTFAHDLIAGLSVVIAGSSVAGYNGTVTVVNANPSGGISPSKSFTYTLPAGGSGLANAGAGTVTIAAPVYGSIPAIQKGSQATAPYNLPVPEADLYTTTDLNHTQRIRRYGRSIPLALITVVSGAATVIDNTYRAVFI